LAPFRRILNWTSDEIQHLVTDAKSELLDPAAHTFHVLHIYIARKPTPTSMCASVDGTVYLRRRTELTLDQGDCADGSHSTRNTSR
ncbi:hypothetical protein KXW37_000381, partial [Aspergillus fumigatus]